MFTNSDLFSYKEGTTHNNDIEIFYRDYGPDDAEPILLVQGLGGQLINWPQHLIEYLFLLQPIQCIIIEIIIVVPMIP